MPTKKSVSSVKKSSSTSVRTGKKITFTQKIHQTVKKPYLSVVGRIHSLLLRRPHRSFRRTRRRDYVRPLRLPSYWSFTNSVRKMLWQQKTLFFWMVIIYGTLTVLLVGLAAQDTYTQLSDILRSTSSEVFKGNWGTIGQAGLLLATGITGSMSTHLTEVQQMYAVIIGVFTWLTTVWLLRAVLANRKPKLRDGLYNAGAPVLPTFLVALVLVIQLLPIVLAVIGFTALVPYGILDGGVESMLFWTVALLLTSLSLYWITSTFIALVVVTLPGMYPLQAIRTAGDLVIGRRVRILLRMLWLLLIVVMLWVLVMVPIILFDTWLKGMLTTIQWLPIVPVALLIMGTLTVVWSASYIYLLYRRIVDDDAAPA
jgi:hypothetical protein